MVPNAGCHLMRRDALPGGSPHIGFEVIQGVFQPVMVTIRTGCRHAHYHAAPLSLGEYQSFLPLL
jgi:hypothetical protein